MNAQKDLLQRLLKLYPVKVVKEHFNENGKADDMIKDIIANNTPANISKFAAENIYYTRQHIFIFNLNKVFKSANFTTQGFPLTVITAKNVNNICEITCAPTVDFDVIVINPYLVDNIKFFQPINITVKDKVLVVKITSLEKNLSHYYGQGRKVVDTKRNNGEDVSLDEVIKFFTTAGYTITTCDLHKGIKKLWENDIIDGKYLKSKKSRSTDTITMDENFTMKKEYPKEYKEFIKKPIIKTLFRYVGKPDDLICNHFNIDPALGFIGVASFPENTTQIENLVNEIIKHN